jgi:hypothetical protein
MYLALNRIGYYLFYIDCPFPHGRPLFCLYAGGLEWENILETHKFDVDAMDISDIIATPDDPLQAHEAPPQVYAPSTTTAASTTASLKLIKKNLKHITKHDQARLLELRRKRSDIVGAIAVLNTALQTKQSELYHINAGIHKRQTELYELDLAIEQGMGTVADKLTGVYTGVADAYKVAKGC